MSEAVMRKHIELYVTHFTSYLGEEGKKAVVKLMQVFAETTGTAVNTGDLFV